MKLWQKIFLTTLALMAFSTTLVSTLLLRESRDALWQRESQRAVAQQQYIAGLLRTGVVSYRLQLGQVQLEEAETRRVAAGMLAQQTSGSYLSGLLLLDDAGEVLYDSMPEGLGGLPEPAAGEADVTVYELRRGDGDDDQWYLICSMPVTLESHHFRLGTAFYVGDLQKQLADQAESTVMLCLTLSVIGAGLLLLLVWFLLRRLSALNESARRIADGCYDERITVRGRDELTGLAQNMNTMAEAVQDRVERLEQVAEERKIFIGNLAHEMKTPLTSILGFADLLYLPKEMSDSKRMEYAGVISDEARRLRSLSGKLLELITLGSSGLMLEPVSLSAVAEEVELSMRPVMTQSNLELCVRCPDVPVNMDRELFKSLLYNLLDNARKASERGSRLYLVGRTEGEAVTVMVRDYGRGIPKDEIDKIMEPFYMVDKSRARRAGGAGLGLALCREIVSVHSGTMHIKSVLGQGTLITMTFPVSRQKGEASHA